MWRFTPSAPTARRWATSTSGLGFWAMLPLGAVMAALAGALLGFPVLRMHGDYLAIVTLGFGEIIRPGA